MFKVISSLYAVVALCKKLETHYALIRHKTWKTSFRGLFWVLRPKTPDLFLKIQLYHFITDEKNQKISKSGSGKKLQTLNKQTDGGYFIGPLLYGSKNFFWFREKIATCHVMLLTCHATCLPIATCQTFFNTFREYFSSISSANQFLSTNFKNYINASTALNYPHID